MKISVIIDNSTYEAKQGETILEVARRNNIDIPTLCFLKGINEPASCRVCVVEVEGMRNLCTACSTKVRDEMIVKTNTKKVIDARRNALELLLSNHNKKCLSCSKNLNCELQKLTNQFSCDVSKYEGEMTNSSYDDSNNAIVRDTSKCILCGKCVAVCAKRQGCHAIGKINRGFDTKVSPAYDSTMQESTCVGCGQCTLVCPTAALTMKSELNDVLELLDKKDVIKVAQVAPAVRVSIAEAFGAKIGTFAEGKMVTALKKCGFDFVFDVNNGADLTVIEESNELIAKLKSGKGLPLFTSCCPAWFNYCEKFYPEFAQNLSSTKSPNEMLGSLVKYYFEKQEKKVEIVSVMPCTAKKREVIAHGIIEKSITTRELADLIRLKGVDFNSLEESKFDNPFSEYTGAGLIFGVTGGVTEAALRYTAYKLTGKKHDIIEDVRYSEGIKEVCISIGTMKLNLAIVHGLANAQKVLDSIKDGTKNYHFVEIMACPGGCVNGGGQILVDYNKTPVEEVIKKRSHAIYKADGDCKFKTSDENQTIKNIYSELLKNDHKLIHKLLHYVHTDDKKYK